MSEKLHEALFWHKEKAGKTPGVQCELCARECFIVEDARGVCGVRENKDNKLFSLNYGKVIALNVDPIEKKPLYHFHPGSFALSYACAGCNWKCAYCCNWDISQAQRPERLGTKYEPEQIVEMAERENVKIISHTYTEPTVFFEFALEVARLAHKRKIKNTFVTNGYITEKPLREISGYLDAATVDFKASGDESFLQKYASVPSVKPVFKTLKLMKELRIHTEITDLIVPKVGENREKLRELAEWIFRELGPDTPFHIIRFFPSYKMTNFESTPISTLDDFAREAKKTGLKYVYVGNVPGHDWENTHCPKCNELLIERIGFGAKSSLSEDKCPKCGVKLEGFVI